MDIKKKFTIKKGSPDYKVWTRVNDFIFNLMQDKRRFKYKHRNLTKDVKITITLTDNKTKEKKE